MLVRATQRGYYGVVLREPGHEFKLKSDADFHESWMEKVTDGKGKGQKGQKSQGPVGNRPQPEDDDVIAARIAATDRMEAEARAEDAENSDVI